ncbi:WD40-repeat-containing domain protein [Zopfochytrium polystomum]|nr:WD40-repeat-containing domain protein [Zopfochytrium polystomum]
MHIVPIRTLGYVNSSQKVAVTLRGSNAFFAISPVNRCFHLYNLENMRLALMSAEAPGPITHLAAIDDFTFAACTPAVSTLTSSSGAAGSGSTIVVYDRAAIVAVLSVPVRDAPFHENGDEDENSDAMIEEDGESNDGGDTTAGSTSRVGNVSGLMIVGSVLVASVNNRLIMWNWLTKDYVGRISLESDFCISAMLHPSTYINKILVGSDNGRLLLVNHVTRSIVYEFPTLPAGISVLTQAPALDVAGVGLMNGSILVMNLKFGVTLRAFDQGNNSIVSCLSFKSDTGGKDRMGGGGLLASSDADGHVFLWDLELGKLAYDVPCHKGLVHTCEFLKSQPIMLTSGSDNSIKQWIFDSELDPPRIWKQISGHSKPVVKIRYVDREGKLLVSSSHDGTLRKLSTIQEAQNMEFSTAAMKKNPSIESDVAHSYVIDFDAYDPTLTTWDNVITCHANDSFTRTWTSRNGSLGSNACATTDGSPAKVVALSSCGSFAFIGSAKGSIDMYNVQSGNLKRKFDKAGGHKKIIVALAADALSIHLVSAAIDSCLKIWNIPSGKLEHTVPLPSSVSSLCLNRETNLIAIACDDMGIRVIDLDTRTTVREFWGHTNRILDLSLSPDSRLLASSSLDATIRMWDMPTGALSSVQKVDEPATCVVFSPDGNHLATTHVNERGVVLWADASIFGKAPPSLVAEMIESQNHAAAELSSAADKEAALLRLSKLPLSRVQLVMNIEVFKKREIPEELVNRPQLAPFFLGAMNTPQAVKGVDFFTGGAFPLSVENGQSEEKAESHVRRRHADTLVDEGRLADVDIDDFIARLLELSPAGLDFEIRLLTDPADREALLRGLVSHMKKGLDYEFLQAVLHLFLSAHGDEFLNASIDRGDSSSTTPKTNHPLLDELIEGVTGSWASLEELFHSNLSILEFIRY